MQKKKNWCINWINLISSQAFWMHHVHRLIYTCEVCKITKYPYIINEYAWCKYWLKWIWLTVKIMENSVKIETRSNSLQDKYCILNKHLYKNKEIQVLSVWENSKICQNTFIIYTYAYHFLQNCCCWQSISFVMEPPVVIWERNQDK